MWRYYDLLSDLSTAEIETLQQQVTDGEVHPKAAKMQLAREITARFHDKEAAAHAEVHFETVFKKHDLPDDIPEYSHVAEDSEIWLPKLLLAAGLVKGTGDARRMIKQNAVSVAGKKVTDLDYNVECTGDVLLQVGKRKFCKVIFS
jgi:tyrosyl-tRNA synthetase